MRYFNIGRWLIQVGFGEWSWPETFLVEYEEEETHYHRVVYFGPLIVSWETIED